MSLTSAELCAGGGGAALGIEGAGFGHVLVAEMDTDACATLRLNRPGWKVTEGDIRGLDGRQLDGLDLLSGGVPCSPFTSAGWQLGEDDERDLLEALGYAWDWRVLQASDYGVPQLRPRSVLVAAAPAVMSHFRWPARCPAAPSVGEVLGASMASRGWEGADPWGSCRCGDRPDPRRRVTAARRSRPWPDQGEA